MLRKGFVVQMCMMCGVMVYGVSDVRAQALEDLYDRVVEHPEHALGYGARHIGGVYLQHTRGGYYDPEEREEGRQRRNSTILGFEAAALFVPTLFGSMGGMEAGAALGGPLSRSFFGGLRGHIGLMVCPIPLEYVKFTVAMGVAMGGHRHAYIKPRLALRLPGPFEVEAWYRWAPDVTSRVFGEEMQLGDVGFDDRRLRVSVWVNVLESSKYGDLDRMQGLHLFVERTEVRAQDAELLLSRRVEEGMYWSGGVGWSF